MNRYKAATPCGYMPDSPRLLVGEDPLAYSARIVARDQARRARRQLSEPIKDARHVSNL